jgi:hypothetical protein
VESSFLQTQTKLEFVTAAPFLSDLGAAPSLSEPEVRGRIACHLDVGFNHFLHQIHQTARRWIPSKLIAGLGWVTKQQLHFGWAEVALVDFDDGLALERAVAADEAHLVDALTLEHNTDPSRIERQLAEPPYRGCDSRRHDVIIGRVALQHEPHAPHIITRMTPVALRAQVAKRQAVLHAQLDAGDRHRNLAGHKVLATPGGFVVEQDAVAGKHVVGLAVVFHNPKAVEFCDAVRRPRVKWRGLFLRDLVHQTIELRG